MKRAHWSGRLLLAALTGLRGGGGGGGGGGRYCYSCLAISEPCL